jgi:hypothetical protein
MSKTQQWDELPMKCLLHFSVSLCAHELENIMKVKVKACQQQNWNPITSDIVYDRQPLDKNDCPENSHQHRVTADTRNQLQCQQWCARSELVQAYCILLHMRLSGRVEATFSAFNYASPWLFLDI